MAKKKGVLSDSLEQARSLLSQNGNRLTLMLGLLLWLPSLLFYRFFYVGVAVLSGVLYLDTDIWGLLFFLGYFVIALAYTLLVVFPLLLGVLRLARSMARGEEVSIASVFEAFSHRRTYWRTVLLGDQVVGQAIAPMLIGLVLCAIPDSNLEDGWIKTLICAAIVLLLLGLNIFVWCRGFWLLGFSQTLSGLSIRKVKQEVRKAGRHTKGVPLRYFFFFLPRILFGIVTLGIYLLAEALPLIMLTYFCECEKTQNLMKHLEEIDHE